MFKTDTIGDVIFNIFFSLLVGIGSLCSIDTLGQYFYSIDPKMAAIFGYCVIGALIIGFIALIAYQVHKNGGWRQ